MSGSATVTSENVIDSVSQLGSNLSIESKRNKLLNMKAKHPHLFTDLQTYLQVRLHLMILVNYSISLVLTCITFSHIRNQNTRLIYLNWKSLFNIRLPKNVLIFVRIIVSLQ